MTGTITKDLIGIIEEVNQSAFTLRIAGITFPVEEPVRPFITYRKVGEKVNYSVKTDDVTGQKTITYVARAKDDAQVTGTPKEKEQDEVFLISVTKKSLTFSLKSGGKPITQFTSSPKVFDKLEKIPKGSTIRIVPEGDTIGGVDILELAGADPANPSNLAQSVTECAMSGTPREELMKKVEENAERQAAIRKKCPRCGGPLDDETSLPSVKTGAILCLVCQGEERISGKDEGGRGPIVVPETVSKVGMEFVCNLDNYESVRFGAEGTVPEDIIRLADDVLSRFASHHPETKERIDRYRMRVIRGAI